MPALAAGLCSTSLQSVMLGEEFRPFKMICLSGTVEETNKKKLLKLILQMYLQELRTSITLAYSKVYEN